MNAFLLFEEFFADNINDCLMYSNVRRIIFHVVQNRERVRFFFIKLRKIYNDTALESVRSLIIINDVLNFKLCGNVSSGCHQWS